MIDQDLFPQTLALGQRMQRGLKAASALLSGHRKMVSVLAGVFLVGAGATAVAIDPLLDLNDIPTVTIEETSPPLVLDDQFEALANHEFTLSRSDLTKPSDTPASLLKRLNIADPQALDLLRKHPLAKKLFVGDGQKMVRAISDRSGRLQSLVARYASADDALQSSHFQRLTIERQGERFDVRHDAKVPLVAEHRLGSGTIEAANDFFTATDNARLPTPVAEQLAKIFEGSIEFRRGLAQGDTFSVMYETLTADGEPIHWVEPTRKQSAQGRRTKDADSGRVLAAEFVNKGRTHTAIWFQLGDRGAYFDQQGQSLKRPFLASPLAFTRLSSGFAMRVHPIEGRWRQHNGVDYAAPKGTTVRTVGDGVVAFAGWQNGYGNVVEINHSQGRSTLYAHLSRASVKKGQRVEQGSKIGEVGSTGWSTGPHLHFEFKQNGRQLNPLTIASANEQLRLSANDHARFKEEAQRSLAHLELTEPAPRSSGGRFE